MFQTNNQSILPMCIIDVQPVRQAVTSRSSHHCIYHHMVKILGFAVWKSPHSIRYHNYAYIKKHMVKKQSNRFFSGAKLSFSFVNVSQIPKCSMYGICVYIYPKTGPNVGKYSIHGASGNCRFNFSTTIFDSSWPSSKDGLRENPKQKPLFSHQLWGFPAFFSLKPNKWLADTDLLALSALYQDILGTPRGKNPAHETWT